MKLKVLKWSVPTLLHGSIFAVLLICDIVLKAYTAGFLDHPIHVFSLPFGVSFYLERVVNQGAMWGMLSQYSGALLVFRILVVLALIATLLFTKKRKPAVFLTLLITGAVGNIADTLAYGHVIDMLHFTFFGNSYGIFNLADAYICIGCIGLIALSFVNKEKKSDSSQV